MRIEANREEAERAATIGREHRQRGDVVKALKFFEISHRLHPTRELQEEIIRLRELTSTSSSQASSNSSTNSPSPWHGVREILYRFVQRAEELENKYIAPHMKIYIRSMLCVIVYLIVWRLFLRNNASHTLAFGSLPGDISFSGNNFTFSSPIISMLIINVVANGLIQAFRRNR